MSATTLRSASVSERAPRRRGSTLRRAVAGSIEGRVGAGLLALVLAVAVLGPTVAPYSPTATAVGRPLAGPSTSHLLGTDQLGRDVLSRVLSGAGSVLLVPLLAVAVVILVGVCFGLVSGYLGGRVDTVITRVLDLLLATPPLLTVLVIAAALGTSNVVLVIALSLVSIPKTARVIRGATRDLASREFIEAAQARGERSTWILVREITPNLAPTLLVEIAIRFTFTIVFVATLNFLGLGVQPPSPNWGLMVAQGRDYVEQAPLMTLAPAIAIAILVIATHLLADALTSELAARSDATGR